MFDGEIKTVKNKLFLVNLYLRINADTEALPHFTSSFSSFLCKRAGDLDLCLKMLL